MRSLLALALVFVGAGAARAETPKLKTENVIFIMLDGLRWQEVFSGADEALMNKERGGVPDVTALRETYWRDTPADRREVLMPFLWDTVGKQGQLYGNQAAHSVGRVTN